MNNESDIYEVIYCADDDEYRVFCDICDKLCIERFYKNHLKSGTQKNKFYKTHGSIVFKSPSTESKKIEIPTKAYIDSLYDEKEQT